MTDIPPAPGQGPQYPPQYPPPQQGYQPYPGQPVNPYGAYGVPTQPPRNGMGTAGMVLGIIAVVVFLLSWVAMIIGILAIIFSAIGRNRVKQGLASNRGQATAGLICGIVGTILGTVVLVLAIWVLDKAKSCTDQYPDGGPGYTQCVRDSITN